ncbi:helix-turn-helix domain-containing protein [Methylomonas koyamae]|uniref:AAA family ATPase n=1 Tax=Methylomonas koyamae TaxID=702114 RepID=A0A291IL13_9GAMM|nr:ATP-binding protein [Methylomonas koyamae]ATG90896.1 AAA family ATPase [Methylomonas koyamae]OAI28989.1 AAA family ATPase [Methylomonas koyamae]
MKRFFLLLLNIWKQKLKIYFLAAWIGAGMGIFLLAPSYDYISSRERNADPISSIEFVIGQFTEVMTGQINQNNLILFYAEIGALLGLLSLGFYQVLHKRLVDLDALKAELDKDLPTIIRQGEGPLLEFKSTLRWDLQEQRVNRSLESVVLKTLAGFFNSHVGGTLLIGVADNGEIVGLEQDFQTLKKSDQDGFEQTLITAIAENLGADLCRFVHILFHRIDNKDVCRVIVSPALRPVFLNIANTPKFFVRTGGGTRDLNIQEALDYVAGRWKSLK